MKFLIVVLFSFIFCGVSLAIDIQEINKPYSDYHKELSDAYYKNKPFRGELLSKDEFEKLHSLNGLNRKKQLLENSIIEDKNDKETIDEVNIKIDNTKKIKTKDKSGKDSKIEYIK